MLPSDVVFFPVRLRTSCFPFAPLVLRSLSSAILGTVPLQKSKNFNVTDEFPPSWKTMPSSIRLPGHVHRYSKYGFKSIDLPGAAVLSNSCNFFLSSCKKLTEIINEKV